MSSRSIAEKMQYQAASPDEIALVEWTEEVGNLAFHPIIVLIQRPNRYSKLDI